MLDSILECINNLPCISFENYFTNYVIEMQDTSIDKEISFLCHNKFLSTNSMIKLSSDIDKELARIVKHI